MEFCLLCTKKYNKKKGHHEKCQEMNAISAQERAFPKKTQGQPGIGEEVRPKASIYSTPFIERTYGSQTHHVEVVFWPFYGNNPRIQDAAAAGLNIVLIPWPIYDVALCSPIFRPSHSQYIVTSQYYFHIEVSSGLVYVCLYVEPITIRNIRKYIWGGP